MKIKCPHCLKTTELEHVEYNSLIECVCLQTFQVNEETVVEETPVEEEKTEE